MSVLRQSTRFQLKKKKQTKNQPPSFEKVQWKTKNLASI